jgi:hypothetical protein
VKKFWNTFATAACILPTCFLLAFWGAMYLLCVALNGACYVWEKSEELWESLKAETR